MCDSEDNIANRHNYRAPEKKNHCKSDINLINNKSNPSKSFLSFQGNTIQSCGEYYKRYEHDETPVKDFISISDTNAETVGDSERNSFTNSQLDKIEKEVLMNVSQTQAEFSDKASSKSLDANIKFVKATVQKIFDTFYTTMEDFDLYKQRFQDILAKKREDSVAEMDDFIKEMIQHIISSESSCTNESNPAVKSTETSTYIVKDNNGTSDESDITSSVSRLLDNLQPVVEAYKNDNYMTDSTLEENTTKKRRSRKEIFNIYLLNTTPCVEIKMTDRNLVSEINIKDQNISVESKVASAENLKKLAAKRTEMEHYAHQEQDFQVEVADRDIPVKISSARKDIHLDEDFINDRDKEENNSFIFKICNYICKKFRKNSFG